MPPQPRFVSFASLAVFSLLLFLSGGCRSQLLRSTWIPPISEADSSPDWWSLPAYRVAKTGASLVVANDSSAFYLRLRSSDRSLIQRLRMNGLTVWLQDSKDKSKRLGVHYPIGHEAPSDEQGAPRFLPNAELPPSDMFDMLEQQRLDELELISTDSARNGRKPVEQAEQLGIRVSFIQQEREFEFGLQLTFGEATSWLGLDSKIRVEIESPAMKTRSRDRRDRPERPEGMGGMPPFGGEGGPMGGRPGGRGRPPDGEKSDSGWKPNQPIDVKFLVELAAGPSA